MSERKPALNEWATEFQNFLSCEGVNPPQIVSSKVLEKVCSDLNPDFLKVFSKLAMIHFVMGAFVLLICPQFGIALFDGMGLMTLFMRYGEVACSLACG